MDFQLKYIDDVICTRKIQDCPRLTPWSIMNFSGAYHINVHKLKSPYLYNLYTVIKAVLPWCCCRRSSCVTLLSVSFELLIISQPSDGSDSYMV